MPLYHTLQGIAQSPPRERNISAPDSAPKKTHGGLRKIPDLVFFDTQWALFDVAVVFFDAQLHTVDVGNRLSFECAQSISI